MCSTAPDGDFEPVTSIRGRVSLIRVERAEVLYFLTSARVSRSAGFREAIDEALDLLCRDDVGCVAGDAGSRCKCTRVVRELGL